MEENQRAVFIFHTWGGEQEENVDQHDPVLEQREPKIAHAKHWEEITAQQPAMVKDLDLVSLHGTREDMHNVHGRDKISGMASILNDMNTLEPEMYRVFESSELYDCIMKQMEADKEKPFVGAG